MNPIVLNFAPTGMVATREHSPHVPITVKEIISQVREAVATGITLAHVHARDGEGRPTSDPEVYARIVGGIREFAPDLVVCVSLSGRRARTLEERLAPLQLKGDVKPDMASLTLSSLNFAREASLNAPDTVVEIARRCLDLGILPELEVFDLGMVQGIHYLAGKGMLRPPHYVNILTGGPFVAQPSLLHLGALVSGLPPDTVWAGAGIGTAQRVMTGLAVAAGGGVRTGLEDNLHLDEGRQELATNRQLLERVYAMAAAMGRPLMTSAQFRVRMGLQSGDGKYGREGRVVE
jgi:3-keto-5-aminohexanoate cleavage enzyme